MTVRYKIKTIFKLNKYFFYILNFNQNEKSLETFHLHSYVADGTEKKAMMESQ